MRGKFDNDSYCSPSNQVTRAAEALTNDFVLHFNLGKCTLEFQIEFRLRKAIITLQKILLVRIM